MCCYFCFFAFFLLADLASAAATQTVCPSVTPVSSSAASRARLARAKANGNSAKIIQNPLLEAVIIRIPRIIHLDYPGIIVRFCNSKFEIQIIYSNSELGITILLIRNCNSEILNSKIFKIEIALRSALARAAPLHFAFAFLFQASFQASRLDRKKPN